MTRFYHCWFYNWKKYLWCLPFVTTRLRLNVILDDLLSEILLNLTVMSYIDRENTDLLILHVILNEL